MKSSSKYICAIVTALALGCSSDRAETQGDAGDADGAVASGGGGAGEGGAATNSGGAKPSSGGARPGSGGSSNAGGANNSGGKSESGGTPNAGGTTGSGGKSGSGGSPGSGGAGTGGGKGATTPPGGWTNVTANLANMASECGNLSHLSAKPDEDMLIAGVAQNGLWASTDGGKSWQALGKGAGSDKITNRTSSIVFDPSHPHQFWESGIYNAGGVYVTTDDGDTFHALGDVHHDDLVSVDFADPDRKTLVAGGHEQKQTVYLSTDSGATWVNVGANLPGGTNFSSVPLLIDAQTYLVGLAGYAGGTSGIFRTTNAGKAWAPVTSSGGVGAPLWAKSGDIYWASNDGVAKSTDKGVSFTNIPANGQLKASAPIELPDGRIAMVGSQTIMVSSDGAASWHAASAALPYNDAVGLAYSAQQKALFIWRFSCDNPVPANAIMRFDFDYEKN